MIKKIVYKIENVARIYSGGDKPECCSNEKNDEFSVPIYSNGLENEGLYGYTNKAQIEGDCITVSARGVNIGTVFYRQQPFLPIVRLLSVIPDRSKINPKYLYYYFKTDKIIGTGSAQPQITIPFFSKKKIYVFENIETQKKIASVLSAYDNLIENNNKRIKILEQVAENLYKEWFVRFRFPGHETTPLENGIPKGWNYKRIYELYNTTSGGTPSRTNNSYYDNGNIPWVKTGELLDSLITDTEEFITEEGLKNSSAKMIEPGSLLCSMYAGVGKLGINIIPMTCSQATCVFTPKTDISIWYLFFWLKRNKEYLESISFGAAQQNISQDIIKKITVLFPTESVASVFDEKIKPIYQKIQNLMQQNANLIKQRDLLLPRLMSGKLEICKGVNNERYSK